MLQKKSSFGAYKICDTCTHKSCCSDYDSATLLSNDIKNIIEKTGKTEAEFCRTIKYKRNDIKVLKRKPNFTDCIFLDEKTKQCSIYENRPLDCKMFPFDVNYINASYRWVIYLCNDGISDWSWTDNHLKKLENDPQFDAFMKHIVQYKLHSSFEIDKSKEYVRKILRKISWKSKN